MGLYGPEMAGGLMGELAEGDEQELCMFLHCFHGAMARSRTTTVFQLCITKPVFKT